MNAHAGDADQAAGDGSITQRGRDTRPVRFLWPAKGDRNATVSDAHEILRLLRELPAERMAVRHEREMAIVQAKTSERLYEPDILVEVAHNEAKAEYDASRLTETVVSTLEAALRTDPMSDDSPWEPDPSMASLATLAACRATGAEGMRPEAVGWSPTPWCEAGVAILGGSSRRTLQAVPRPLRTFWSTLVQPAVRIGGRGHHDSPLCIRLMPVQVAARRDLDPMERIRLEAEMAPLLAGMDEGASW